MQIANGAGCCKIILQLIVNTKGLMNDVQPCAMVAKPGEGMLFFCK